MALKKFHLIKDRFLFDDYESGLYFDLWPVKRSGNEDEFGSIINNANEKVKQLETDPAHQGYLCTLFLTEQQMYGIPEKYRNQYAAKSQLLLFKAGFDGKALPDTPWFSIQAGGMVCDPTGAQSKWIYYTNWTANNLGFRFRRVNKAEVDAYVVPGSGGTTPPADDDEEPGTPTVPSGELTMHLVCPHCGKLIF